MDMLIRATGNTWVTIPVRHAGSFMSGMLAPLCGGARRCRDSVENAVMFVSTKIQVEEERRSAAAESGCGTVMSTRCAAQQKSVSWRASTTFCAEQWQQKTQIETKDERHNQQVGRRAMSRHIHMLPVAPGSRERYGVKVACAFQVR